MALQSNVRRLQRRDEQDVLPRGKCGSLMARHSFSFGDTCRKWWRSCATVLTTARDVLRIGSRRRANTDPIATNRRRPAAMAHFLRRLASAFRRLPDKYLRLRKRGISTESA